MLNRLNPQRAAFIAGMVILGTCEAGGQTLPLRDPTVAQKPLMPLSATDPVVHKGLFTIDVVVTDAAGKPVSGLARWDFTPSRRLFLQRRRGAIHNIVGRGRERDRQIGIRRQRLTFRYGFRSTAHRGGACLAVR